MRPIVRRTRAVLDLSKVDWRRVAARATGINNAAAHLEMETSPEMDFLSADSRQRGPVQAKHAYVEAGAPLENKLRHYLTHDAAELETMT